MKYILTLGILTALIAGTALFLTSQKEVEPAPVTPVAADPAGLATFTWSFETSDKEGIPQTDILLSAVYENGMSEMNAVDQVEGTCNEYENRDADVYEGSTMIICYYAGLGHYYKVVAEPDGYAIKRKVFEEASPDYEPPAAEYEVIWQYLTPS